MSRYARGRSRSKSRSNTPRPLSSRVLEDDDLEEKHQVFKGPDEGTKKIFDIKELKKITVNIIRKVPQKKGQEKPKITFDPTTVAPVRRPVGLNDLNSNLVPLKKENKIFLRDLKDDDLVEKHQVFKGPDERTKKIFDIKELKKITVNIIRKVPQKEGQEKLKITFDPTTVAPVRRPALIKIHM